MSNPAIENVLKTNHFKVSYDDKEGSVFIQDSMKQQGQLTNIALGFTIISSLLNIFSNSAGRFSWFWGMGILIGLVCSILLAMNLLRKTGKEKLKISEIVELQEQSFIGRKTYRLKLQNGKFRYFFHLKNRKEIEALKSFFSDLGIH